MPRFNATAHLEGLIKDCEACAQQYRDKPGTFQVATVIDLYQAIARLATIVKLAHENP